MSEYSHAPTPSQKVLEELNVFDSLTQQLLSARGIKTYADAEIFFSRDYERGLHDPFLLPDMEKAVARILLAIEHQEKITIFSDYDCDGIPGAALMHDFFTTIGYTHFSTYIPHRHQEGYGMSVEAIDEIKKEGASLLITIDCGSTDTEEVAYAQALGIDVVVTDHHELGDILPDACAVINPKRKDSKYPFSGLCGTGVAFKLITALIARGSFSITPGQEKWFLDLVGIATIADMVPLQDENRLFAHYGLMVMRKGRRLGLQHLFRVMKTPLAHVTEDDIGFMIGPRINAASRMGSPMDAFVLLSTRSEEEAGTYAAHLESINAERKGVVAAMVKDARRRLALRSSIDAVIVIGDPAWRPSLVGLVANALVEEYDRPVFVWGRDGRNILKGSCRSNGVASVFALMQKVAPMFLEYGGHHASGGFAVKEECIHILGDALNIAYGSLSSASVDERVPRTPCVDAILTLEDVAPALVRSLARFAPYGEGNPKPVFLFQGVAPLRVEIFGKQKAHTKLLFRNGTKELSAIGFFMLPDAYGTMPVNGVPIDMLAHVEESFFMGRAEIRLRIISLTAPCG